MRAPLPVSIHRGKPAIVRQFGDPWGMREEDSASDHEQRARPRRDRRLDGALNFPDAANLEQQQLPPSFPRSSFGCLPATHAGRVNQNGDQHSTRD